MGGGFHIFPRMLLLRTGPNLKNSQKEPKVDYRHANIFRFDKVRLLHHPIQTFPGKPKCLGYFITTHFPNC
ncbi:hypothetical protein I79_016628 [Cricetulus griseus]|uniref:Uncharacterized protein n=1 Tax=Cricetulus griseus TaxID=10029 RepID=G3HZW4_CRIGR|nr:hypothetical protein I79_016628 [Cricetulus griseus]